MQSKTIGHSKYKNTGVLFELLVRRMAADAMENRVPSPATKILKEFFNPNTELGKEILLYRSFFEVGTLTENKALKFIDIVAEQRKRLNNQQLAKEKFRLVNEIKRNYSIKDFLACKIPNYKIHAAIYKTFSSEQVSLTENIMNIHEIAKSRFTLVEHLVTKKVQQPIKVSKGVEEFLKQDPMVQNMVYQKLVNSFNERYKNLTESQKNLLREYINSVADVNKFNEYVRKDVKLVVEQLNGASKKVNNKVIQIKLNEAVNQLNKISSKKQIKQNDVSALMIAHEIKKEIIGE